MMTRAVAWWIAVQTLLGAWFVWLLCSAPAPAAAEAPANVPRQEHPDPAIARANVPDDTQRQEVPAGSAAPADLATDPTGILLYGRITDIAGQPVGKALLSIRQFEEHRGASESGTSGVYALAGLLPGDAGLLVRTDGFRNHAESLKLAGTAQRRDIVLQRAIVLQVIVRTPEGQPLETALRAAGMDERINPSAIATREPVASLPVLDRVARLSVGRFHHARWYGRVEIEGAPPELLGTLELIGDLPVHVSLIAGPAVLATRLVEPGQDRVEFTLAPTALRERLGGIRVQLVAAANGSPLPAVRVEGPGVKITDADGTAEFIDIVPGLHRLTARSNLSELDHLVRVAPGQKVDLGRLALEEPSNVSGLIVDAKGEPTRATLAWDDLSGHSFAQPLRDDRTAGSKTDGTWQLRLGRRRFALHARTGEGAQQAHLLLDLTAGVPAEIRLQLQPTVQVKLIKQFGSGRAYLLSIRTRDGVPVFGSFIHHGFEQSIRLSAGDYTAQVHDDLELVRTFGFTAGTTGTQIRIP